MIVGANHSFRADTASRYSTTGSSARVNDVKVQATCAASRRADPWRTSRFVNVRFSSWLLATPHPQDRLQDSNRPRVAARVGAAGPRCKPRARASIVSQRVTRSRVIRFHERRSDLCWR